MKNNKTGLCIVVLAIYCMALGSCKQAGNNGNTTANSGNESCYLAFSQRLAQSIQDRDPDFFNAHFDFEALVNEIVTRVEAPTDYKEGFKSGIQHSLNVGNEIVGSLGFEGSYHFLRLKNVNNQPTALCRLTTPEGINYHEIQLGTRGDSCYIKDFYIYRGGLDFSATLKRLYFSSLADIVNDSISFDQTSPFDRAFIEHLSDIDQIAALTEQEDYKAALQIADKLPDILRTDKMILVMRTNIAHQVSKDAFEFTLSDFKDHYPSDPVIEFLALDLAFAEAKPDLILQRIDELDAKLQGDPYLNVLRAGVYEAQKETDKAESLYRKTMIAEPDNQEVPFMLCLFLIKHQKYDETITLFGDIYDKFDYNPADFLSQSENADFWQSAAYKAWAEKHPLAK
jgi:hypothetical protein